MLAAFLFFFVYLLVELSFPGLLRYLVERVLGDGARPANDMLNATTLPRVGTFSRIVNAISLLAIPFFLSFFPLYAALRRVKVYEEFVDGAKEGFQGCRAHHSLPGDDSGCGCDVPGGARNRTDCDGAETVF